MFLYSIDSSRLTDAHIEGILPKGPYPPCLRMADKALLAGYPRYVSVHKAVTGSHNGLPSLWCQSIITRKYILLLAVPWASYQMRKTQVANEPGMPGTFSHHRLHMKPLVRDAGMHRGKCVTQVEIANQQRWGKRSRHSRRMRNPQFYVSGERPIGNTCSWYFNRNKTTFAPKHLFQNISCRLAAILSQSWCVESVQCACISAAVVYAQVESSCSRRECIILCEI